MTFTESSDSAGFKLAYGGALTVGSCLAAAAAFSQGGRVGSDGGEGL